MLRISNEQDTPLNANHMSMCRFASSKDPNFRLVSHAMLSIAQSISEDVDDLDSNPAQSLRCRSGVSHRVPRDANSDNVALTDSKRRYISHFEKSFRVNVADRVDGTC